MKTPFPPCTDGRSACSMRAPHQTTRRYIAEADRIPVSNLLDKVMDYAQAKRRLTVRLKNAEENKRHADESRCRTVGDIVLVAYLVVSERDSSLTTMRLPKSILRAWNQTEDT